MSTERSIAILSAIRNMARELPTGSANAIINRCNKVQSLMTKGRDYKGSESYDPDEQTEVLENQIKTVHAYLLAGNSITSLQAFKKFGITRLSAVIFNIEKMTGRAPNRRRITVQNRDGKYVSVCEYWIDPEGMKICPKCGRCLPLEDFAECPENSDGRTYYCRECLVPFTRDENRGSARV